MHSFPVPAEQLYHIFWEAVERLERCDKSHHHTFAAKCTRSHIFFNRMDIKVLGVTCDGCSVNRRFLRLHNQCGSGDVTHKMPNPFATDEREMYFISDPPHLIKTVRNCWASNKRSLWVCE